MGHRHGLITGATGTGKTITLQNLAESFSALGVPVLLTDIKGDLSAVCQPGAPGGSIAAREKTRWAGAVVIVIAFVTELMLFAWNL